MWNCFLGRKKKCLSQVRVMYMQWFSLKCLWVICKYHSIHQSSITALQYCIVLFARPVTWKKIIYRWDEVKRKWDETRDLALLMVGNIFRLSSWQSLKCLPDSRAVYTANRRHFRQQAGISCLHASTDSYRRRWFKMVASMQRETWNIEININL